MRILEGFAPEVDGAGSGMGRAIAFELVTQDAIRRGLPAGF